MINYLVIYTNSTTQSILGGKGTNAEKRNPHGNTLNAFHALIPGHAGNFIFWLVSLFLGHPLS